LKRDGERDSVFWTRCATGADDDGRRSEGQEQLFYAFRLEEAVPDDLHLDANDRRAGARPKLTEVTAALSETL
jgi:hypothetical protein